MLEEPVIFVHHSCREDQIAGGQTSVEPRAATRLVVRPHNTYGRVWDTANTVCQKGIGASRSRVRQLDHPAGATMVATGQ